MNWRVYANRVTAVGWAIFGVLAFWPLRWQDSVALVWLASVYANVKTDWSISEAANDSVVISEIRALRAELRKAVRQLREGA